MTRAMRAAFTSLLAAAASLPVMAGGAIEVVEVVVGDDDGFGGTQGSQSAPGDPYTTFLAPAISPGIYLGVAGMDATTAAPWTPYTFSFSMELDLTAFECLQSVELTVQHGSVARRTDGSGFGFAEIGADVDGRSSALGQLWSTSTGAAGSPAEETVKATSVDLTALLEAGRSVALNVLIDGSALAAPVDSFSIDFVKVRVVGRITPCPTDLNRDGTVDGADLGLLLTAWGSGGGPDLDGSGVVDGADLGLLLIEWSGP